MTIDWRKEPWRVLRPAVWWLLKTLTGRWVVSAGGHPLTHPAFLVHGDTIKVDFLNGSVLARNRWGWIVTTEVHLG